MPARLSVLARVITAIGLTVLLSRPAAAADVTWHYSGLLSQSNVTTIAADAAAHLAITVDPDTQELRSAVLTVAGYTFTVAGPLPIGYAGQSNGVELYSTVGAVSGTADAAFVATGGLFSFDTDQALLFTYQPFDVARFTIVGRVPGSDPDSPPVAFGTAGLAVDTAAPSPTELLAELIQAVMDLNIRNGIANAYDAKLDAARDALGDSHENNDGAAINGLGAFVNAVEAQRGKVLTDEEADALVGAATTIIVALGG